MLSAPSPCRASSACPWERPGPLGGTRGGLFRAGGPAAGFSFCSLSPPCHLSRQNRLSRSVAGRALACSAPFGRAPPGSLQSAALGPGRIGPAAWRGGRPTRGGQWGVREVKRRLIRPFSVSLCFPVTPALSALTPARVPWPVARGRGSRARPRAVPSSRDSAAGPVRFRGSSTGGAGPPSHQGAGLGGRGVPDGSAGDIVVGSHRTKGGTAPREVPWARLWCAAAGGLQHVAVAGIEADAARYRGGDVAVVALGVFTGAGGLGGGQPSPLGKSGNWEIVPVVQEQ